MFYGQPEIGESLKRLIAQRFIVDTKATPHGGTKYDEPLIRPIESGVCCKEEE